MHQLCLPMGLEDADIDRLDQIIGKRRRLERDEPLYKRDEPPGAALLRHFHRIMSQEITREQNVTLLLGNMRAEQRFAIFLVNLSARHAARGDSSTRFQPRMSREDMANYLGPTIESISRLLSRLMLSRLKKLGLVQVDKREVVLLEPARPKAMAAGTEQCSPMA